MELVYSFEAYTTLIAIIVPFRSTMIVAFHSTLGGNQSLYMRTVVESLS